MITIAFLRQFRVGGFAVFDFTVSFLGMLLLAPLLSRAFRKIGIIIPLRNWIFLTIPISIVAHLLTATPTPLTKEFLDPSGFFLVKIVVIGLCVLGATGIKRIARP